MTPIVNWDSAFKNGRPWSPFAWRARLILNYKKLDYRTEWIELAEVAAKATAEGIPKHEKESIAYTIPIVRLPPDSTAPGWVMNSPEVAQTLDTAYPSPPLHVDAPETEQVNELVSQWMRGSFGLFMPNVVKNLNPAGVAYFRETRERRVGMTVEEFGEKKGGLGVFEKNCSQPVAEIIALLQKNKEGPFVRGTEPSYADFIIVAFFIFMQELGPENLEALLKLDQNNALHDLWTASEPYRQKID